MRGLYKRWGIESKRPSFGSEDDGIRRFCKDHKGHHDIDVFHQKCEGCVDDGIANPKRASFGPLGDRMKFCSYHSPNSCIYYPKRKCSHRTCNEYGSWGMSAESSRKCFIHKNPDDINLLKNHCNSCGILHNADLGEMCIHCGNKAFLKTHLNKQIKILELLELNE